MRDRRAGASGCQTGLVPAAQECRALRAAAGSILLTVAALLLSPAAWIEVRSEPGPEPALVIGNGASEQRFTIDQLLRRPDAVMLSVSGDVYHSAVTYRGVPLLAILGDSTRAEVRHDRSGGTGRLRQPASARTRQPCGQRRCRRLRRHRRSRASLATPAAADGHRWSVLPDLEPSGALGGYARTMALSVEPSLLSSRAQFIAGPNSPYPQPSRPTLRRGTDKRFLSYNACRAIV